MSREDEIAQGLREPTGALIGGLNALDYVRGIEDFEAGRPAPEGLTSTSYDLGRSRARDRAEANADIAAFLRRESETRHAKMRELLAHRPDILAEYEAKIAEIEARSQG